MPRPGAIVTRGARRATLGAARPPPRMASVLEDGLLSAVGHPERRAGSGAASPLRRAGLPRTCPSSSASAPTRSTTSPGSLAARRSSRRRRRRARPSGARRRVSGAAGAGGPSASTSRPAKLATVAARAATDLPLVVKLSGAHAGPAARSRGPWPPPGPTPSAPSRPLPAVAIADGHRRVAAGQRRPGGSPGQPSSSVALRVVYEIARCRAHPDRRQAGASQLDDVLDMLAVGPAPSASPPPPWPTLAARPARRGARGVVRALGRRRLSGAGRHGPPAPPDRGGLRRA